MSIAYDPSEVTTRPRDNGYWYAWYKGKPISLHTKVERIAKQRLKVFRDKLLKGKIVNISDGLSVRLKVAVKEFLEHIEQEVEASTYTLYRVALNKCLDSWGEDKLVSHISDRDIDRLVSDMRKAKLKPPTINKNLRHVKAFLKRCHRWKYMQNPVAFPKKIKEQEKLRFLTIEQVRMLFESIGDEEFADFVLFACYSGLRSGEVIRLKWSDIDNPVGFIRIDAQQKNKTESRIPINSGARSILERCKARGTDKPFRFETVSWVSQKFRKAANKCGLLNVREHDLRHTFGAHLAMAGVDIKSIQELMRHETIQSTLVYAKVSPEHLKQESEKLNYGPMVVKK